MSLLFHAFSIPKHWYVFDSNTNCVFSVNKKQYEAFTEIEHGKRTQENEEVLKKFQAKGFCLDVNIESIRHSETDIIDKHLEKKMTQLILQLTQNCNLRCDYCTFSGNYNNRDHFSKSMTFETAKKAIEMALSRSGDAPKFYLSFYGGEPLLELPLIKKCVEYIEYKAPDREFSYSLTTNGTLLTLETYDYLNNNNFNLLLSLDGPKEIHDLSRKFPDGRGSYDIIMSNINSIRENYPELNLMINTVVSNEIDDSCLPSIFKPDETISYFNQTMSLVNNLYADKKHDYSEGFSVCLEHEVCKLLLAMLGRIDRKYISPMVKGRESFYRTKYDSLQRINAIPPVYHPGGPCLAGTTKLFVDADGRFFPCERVSEKSRVMVIGDLDNGFDIDKISALINLGEITENECKACWAITHCTMCAAHADNLTELSRDMRLANCDTVRRGRDGILKILCFLREEGYEF